MGPGGFLSRHRLCAAPAGSAGGGDAPVSGNRTRCRSSGRGLGREKPRAERGCRCPRPGRGRRRGLLCVRRQFCARAAGAVAPRCGVWLRHRGVAEGRSTSPPRFVSGYTFPPAFGLCGKFGGCLLPVVFFNTSSLRCIFFSLKRGKNNKTKKIQNRSPLYAVGNRAVGLLGPGAPG